MRAQLAECKNLKKKDYRPNFEIPKLSEHPPRLFTFIHQNNSTRHQFVPPENLLLCLFYQHQQSLHTFSSLIRLTSAILVNLYCIHFHFNRVCKGKGHINHPTVSEQAMVCSITIRMNAKLHFCSYILYLF